MHAIKAKYNSKSIYELLLYMGFGYHIVDKYT